MTRMDYAEYRERADRFFADLPLIGGDMAQDDKHYQFAEAVTELLPNGWVSQMSQEERDDLDMSELRDLAVQRFIGEASPNAVEDFRKLCR